MTYWIDFNQNGVFETSERSPILPTGSGVMATSFMTPPTAKPGQTKIRIRTSQNYQADPSPCGAYTKGTTRDYTIEILPMVIPPAPVNGCDNHNITSVTLGTLNDSGLTCSPLYEDKSWLQNDIPKIGRDIATPMTVGVNGDTTVNVWIDYNKNGTFEASEFYPLGSSNGGTVTGNFTLPLATEAGLVKMRVRTTGPGAPAMGAGDADNASVSGTTRDYTVEILYQNTQWNGGSGWTNGPPHNLINASIAQDYTGPAFEAKDLTVIANRKLTVNSSVKARNITNNGTIEVADGANFVQTGTYTAGVNGKFIVRVNTKPVKRLAYVAWSSPLKNSALTLKAFSYGKQADGVTNQSTTGTLDNRFYNWANGTYFTIPATGTFVAGKGYQLRTPNDFTTTAETFLGYFEDKEPNSGDITLSDATLNQADDEYIFLGNPYPGSLDIETFLNENPDAGFAGNRTVYVWKSETSDVTGMNLYNTYKNGNVVPNGSITNGKIATGQGFFVEKSAAKTSFDFKNNMRGIDNSGAFLKSASVDRFWLELKSSANVTSQVLMAFQPQATSGYDADWDAKMMGSSTDVIYTTVDNKNLVIDVHGNFVNTDKFFATVKTSAAGSYNISLVGKDGIFNNGQKIYIKDMTTGLTGEISQGAFNFVSNGGVEPNRFEISFIDNSVLATVETASKDVEIYGANSTVYVKADKNIKSVNVYELSGRMIKSVEKTNGNSVEIPVSNVKTVLVSVELADGKVISKKIKL